MSMIIRNHVRYASGGNGGDTSIEITQAEYDELVSTNSIQKDVTYYITDSKDEIELDAATVKYDNTESGLEATDVQSAISELNSNIDDQNKNINVIYNPDDDYIYVMGNKWKFVGIKSHPLIPTLNSNSGSNGYTIVRETHPNCPPWLAFDGNDTTFAYTCNAIITEFEYVGYMFNNPVTISKVYVHGGNGCTEHKTYAMVVQYYNGSTWVTIPETDLSFSGANSSMYKIDKEIKPVTCTGVRVYFWCETKINGEVHTFQVYGTEV